MKDERIESLNRQVEKINTLLKRIKYWDAKIKEASKMKDADEFELEASKDRGPESCKLHVGSIHVSKVNACEFVDLYVKFAKNEVEKLKSELENLMK